MFVWSDNGRTLRLRLRLRPTLTVKTRRDRIESYSLVRIEHGMGWDLGKWKGRGDRDKRFFWRRWETNLRQKA